MEANYGGLRSRSVQRSMHHKKVIKIEQDKYKLVFLSVSDRTYRPKHNML